MKELSCMSKDYQLSKIGKRGQDFLLNYSMKGKACSNLGCSQVLLVLSQIIDLPVDLEMTFQINFREKLELNLLID